MGEYTQSAQASRSASRCLPRAWIPFLLGFVILSEGNEVWAVSIDAYGAVPGKQTVDVAFANSDAIYKALLRANSSEGDARVVHVPSGREYYFMPVGVRNLVNVSLQIDGDLIASTHIDAWPRAPVGSQEKSEYSNILDFSECEGIRVTGIGAIHGRGFNWWLNTIEDKAQDQRPHILVFTRSRDLLIENIRLYNSPMFHIKLSDVEDVEIRRIIIDVDTTQQNELLLARGLWNQTTDIPIFPLNTDGIDPDGRNIYIHNITVTNFDDVVAVKPSMMWGNKYANCTENVLVEDVIVNFGVGMTIGSVPPRIGGNCVRNITFRNIYFHKPFKAIYIKTNPGDVGFGIIENVLYENIYMKDPIWWSVYIGPQQQHQPDGSGPGCMFYPLSTKCLTQPRVTISGVRLKNVTSVGNILRPGIIRCDKENPCTNFEFDDVHIRGPLYDPLAMGGWYCENVHGYIRDTAPSPDCFVSNSSRTPSKVALTTSVPSRSGNTGRNELT